MHVLAFPAPEILTRVATDVARAMGCSKADVLRAAARAVVSRPPLGIIGYTDARLLAAPGETQLRLHPELRRTLRDIARHRFYGRVTWLFWWGLARIHSNELVYFLRADATVLDRFDGTSYTTWTGGHPCQIPPSARAPRPPRPRKK